MYLNPESNLKLQKKTKKIGIKLYIKMKHKYCNMMVEAIFIFDCDALLFFFSFCFLQKLTMFM